MGAEHNKLNKIIEKLQNGFCPGCQYFYLHIQEKEGCPYKEICVKSLTTLKKDKPLYFKTASIATLISHTLNQHF